MNLPSAGAPFARGLGPRLWSLALCVSLSFVASHARATYSVVASDSATSAVGGAGTSCLGGADVYIIYGAVPGVGAVHAQAAFSGAGRDRAVALLEQGQSPAQIILAITAPGFDNQADSRQYAVVDVAGRSAGFTGGDALSFADDVQGDVASYSYSVQGNILTSEAVLSQASAAFEAGGCDLPERLMSALEAGANGGEGDSRCTTTRGIPSDSAFLQVDVPGEPEGSFLSLRVPSSGTDDPLTGLRELFDAWRVDHPCPGPLSDAGAAGARDAGAGASTGGASTGGARGSSRGGGSASGGSGNGGAGGAGAQAGRSGGAVAVAGAGGVEPLAEAPEAGGSCRFAGGSGHPGRSRTVGAAWLVGAALGAAYGRRRSRRQRG
jgi:uncharacterized Ntn-hydrolase superfamily protein